MSLFRNQTTRGYGFALLAAVAMSNVYIFSKAALQEIHIVQFGFYWFGTAVVYNLLYCLKALTPTSLQKMRRRDYLILLCLGLLEIIGTGSFFTAISLVRNPAVVSFLKNLEAIFVTLLGMFILGERFRKAEVPGIALTLAGAVILSYRGGNTLKDLFIEGAGWMVLATASMATRTVIAKSRIQTIPPAVFSLNRVVCIFGFALVMMVALNREFLIPLTAFVNIAIGSLLGPFLTAIAAYSALKYLEAYRTALIQSTTGLFVVAGAYLFFDSLPLPHQITGGVITIAGFIFLSLGQGAVGQGARATTPRRV